MKEFKCKWDKYKCKFNTFGSSDFCLRHHIVNFGDVIYAKDWVMIKTTWSCLAIFEFNEFIDDVPMRCNAVVIYPIPLKPKSIDEIFDNVLTSLPHLKITKFTYNNYSEQSACAMLWKEYKEHEKKFSLNLLG